MIPPVASRFVAGTTPSGAIDHTRELNEDGVKTILNLLGEHYHERGPADEDADAYCSLVNQLVESGVDATISVKPSQIGIDVGPDVFAENLGRIVDVASEHDVFVWVDMEDSTTTDTTLDAFENNVLTYPKMGVCVQANLRRTRNDLERLESLPGKVRLVKGAYNEPEDVAFQSKDAVDEQYESHLRYLFEEWDEGIAVGSHDPKMIDMATDLHGTHGTDFEIQMLMGVRESAQVDLAGEYPVYQYVPYGDKWLSYFYRRLRERKENLLFGLRAVVSG